MKAVYNWNRHKAGVTHNTEVLNNSMTRGSTRSPHNNFYNKFDNFNFCWIKTIVAYGAQKIYIFAIIIIIIL